MTNANLGRIQTSLESNLVTYDRQSGPNAHKGLTRTEQPVSDCYTPTANTQPIPKESPKFAKHI